MAQAFTASADTTRQAANANIAPGPRPSVLDTIGRTPIVRLNNIGPKHVTLYAKLEAFNPMGSVKDRLALGVIEAADPESGEPGSGNNFAFQQIVEVRYPEDTELGVPDGDQATVELATVLEFSKRVTWLFYDHEEFAKQ